MGLRGFGQPVRRVARRARRLALMISRAVSWALGRLDRLLRLADLWAGQAGEAVRDAVRTVPDRMPGNVRDLVRRAARTAERRLSPLRRRLRLLRPAWDLVSITGARLGSLLPRSRTWRRLASGTSLLLLAAVVGVRTAPPGTRPAPGDWSPVFVGYFENGWGGMYGDSFPTFQQQAAWIDFVMPFWYSVHPDGSLEDRGARPEVVALAHRSGVKVVPLLNNAKGPDTAAFLADPAGRAAAVEAIVRTVLEKGYDGVHVDFEHVPAARRDDLTAFVAELRRALGPGLHLSVAVFPKVDVPASLHGLHDYAGLAASCDFLVMMAYDHHYAGGPAGPVSPREWVERSIRHALAVEGLPPGRLVLAVGGYGYDWPGGGGTGVVATTVPSKFAADLAQRRGATLRWDAESGNPYFTYYAGRVAHDVWYQDERVMAQRIAQAREHRLAGVALWRLGYETPQTWAVVRGELGPGREPGWTSGE